MIPSPQKIHNARQQQELVIHWQNGAEHRFNYSQLRAACRCATCRSHKISGRMMLIDADLQLEKINNLGQGLQLVFSDGHERGIYPWQYLFELGAQPFSSAG